MYIKAKLIEIFEITGCNLYWGLMYNIKSICPLDFKTSGAYAPSAPCWSCRCVYLIRFCKDFCDKSIGVRFRDFSKKNITFKLLLNRIEIIKTLKKISEIYCLLFHFIIRICY